MISNEIEVKMLCEKELMYAFFNILIPQILITIPAGIISQLEY